MLAYRNPSCEFKVVDVNSDRVSGWNSSKPPILEPGLQEMLAEVSAGTGIFKDSPFFHEMTSLRELNGAGKAGTEDTEDVPPTQNLTFSNNIAEGIAESDVVFICVDTPAQVNLSSVDHFDMDLTRHDGALRMIAESSLGHTVVVEKSTVPGGTSQRSADSVSQWKYPI